MNESQIDKVRQALAQALGVDPARLTVDLIHRSLHDWDYFLLLDIKLDGKDLDAENEQKANRCLKLGIATR
jgi:hypothetical protein